MPFHKFSTIFFDCYRIIPEIFPDDRGFFWENYHEKSFQKMGISAKFVQDNISKNVSGALRGLHFQSRFPQAKLVSVLEGAIYDVIVDLRPNSPTFGKWQGFFLSEKNKNMIFVPRGFAHGFLSLTKSIVHYKCDNFYDPDGESGIFFADNFLNIDWQKYQKKYGIISPILSKKDAKLPNFLPENFYE